MSNLPHAVTVFVVVLGLTSLFMTRLPAFRKDFRRSVSAIVAIVSLLTTTLSINILVVGGRLRDWATQNGSEHLSAANGLLLTGMLLLLVSALSFFFGIGVLVWTLVPTRRPPSDPASSSTFNPFEAPERRIHP